MKKISILLATIFCYSISYSQANFTLQAGLNKSIYPDLSKYNVTGAIAPTFQFTGSFKAASNMFVGAKFRVIQLGTAENTDFYLPKQVSTYITASLLVQGAIKTSKSTILKMGVDLGIITQKGKTRALFGMNLSESIFFTKNVGVIISSDPFLVGSIKNNNLTISVPVSVGITINQF